MYDLLVINQILGNGINRFAYDLKSTRCIMEGQISNMTLSKYINWSLCD